MCVCVCVCVCVCEGVGGGGGGGLAWWGWWGFLNIKRHLRPKSDLTGVSFVKTEYTQLQTCVQIKLSIIIIKSDLKQKQKNN